MSSGACAYPWQQMNVDLTGEVVPCCFWSGYANAGKPLGNTNLRTLEEIWNGEAYQQLRRANASGNPPADHPCHECLGWQWSAGVYPKFDWPVSFERETGHCFTLIVPERFRGLAAATGETAVLHQDGQPLPHPDAIHDEIRQIGEGRYSYWNDTLYFSSSDNSDARTNGREYELRCGPHTFRLANFKPDSVSGRNMTTAREEYEARAEVLTAKPTMISFIATSDCNIDCPACSQNTVRLLKVQHRERTELDVLRMVPNLTQFIWHGGEPYLIQRFREFVDDFTIEQNPNLSFGFTSNGTLLDAEELAKLAKFPRVNATVSIDSFRRETFEVIRAGANFDTVVANVLRAVERYEAPDFLMHVGMIVTKRNLLELPDNLRFAMEHDIGLNLSPVVVYPAPEQLDVFEDFATQTRGWAEALDAAIGVLEEARVAGAKALRRIDPSGHVKAIEAILERAAQRYAEVVTLEVTVEDPAEALPHMRRPGLVVATEDQSASPMAYVTLDRGPGQYQLQLPRSELGGPKPLNWYLLHDLFEPMGIADLGFFADESGRSVNSSGWHSFPGAMLVEVPPFESVPRQRNIRFANRGLPSPDGMQVADPRDMLLAYKVLQRREYEQGLGLRARVSQAEQMDWHQRLSDKRYGSHYSLV